MPTAPLKGLTGTLLVWLCALPACAPLPQPVAPVARHPWPYRARAISRSVVEVFSGSPAGLIVGGVGPLSRNPGVDLVGLDFTVHDQGTHSYLWAFAPGTKLLDRACKPIDAAAMQTIANSMGHVSAIFIVYFGPNATQIAPAKVEIWNRADGNPANCLSEEPAR